MNSVQIHLALTHVPVILCLVGLVMLITASILKNNTLIKASYFLIIFAGIFTAPVYLSGEGAEEAVERLAGVSETIIEAHEEAAELAMILMVAAALAALGALFSSRWAGAARIAKMIVLVLALATGGFMVQTAHLGGQIRHSEIRNEVVLKGDASGIDMVKNHQDDE